ncbi:MAG: Holliday junction branch migration protein RuvA [Coriobacteriia bacterium]|nr:Holliday junction branch migration protein RuvA [Coriobacteriia bacterium]
MHDRTHCIKGGGCGSDRGIEGGGRMIASLNGRIISKSVGSCILEVSGVGFRLAMTTNALSRLPTEGDEVFVHTYLHVRGEELSLFGFESESEKEAFEKLITVSGVGPKAALAVLSSYTADALASAIGAGDVAVLTSVPGIGKKTAQRIILELADKFVSFAGDGARKGQPVAASEAVAEVADALLAMGFSADEAAVAVKGYDGDADSTRKLLRYALKRLGGAP